MLAGAGLEVEPHVTSVLRVAALGASYALVAAFELR